MCKLINYYYIKNKKETKIKKTKKLKINICKKKKQNVWKPLSIFYTKRAIKQKVNKVKKHNLNIHGIHFRILLFSYENFSFLSYL